MLFVLVAGTTASSPRRFLRNLKLFRRASVRRGGIATDGMLRRFHGYTKFLCFLGRQNSDGLGEHFLLLYGDMLLDETRNS